MDKLFNSVPKSFFDQFASCLVKKKEKKKKKKNDDLLAPCLRNIWLKLIYSH